MVEESGSCGLAFFGGLAAVTFRFAGFTVTVSARGDGAMLLTAAMLCELDLAGSQA